MKQIMAALIHAREILSVLIAGRCQRPDGSTASISRSQFLIGTLFLVLFWSHFTLPTQRNDKSKTADIPEEMSLFGRRKWPFLSGERLGTRAASSARGSSGRHYKYPINEAGIRKKKPYSIKGDLGLMILTTRTFLRAVVPRACVRACGRRGEEPRSRGKVAAARALASSGCATVRRGCVTSAGAPPLAGSRLGRRLCGGLSVAASRLGM